MEGIVDMTNVEGRVPPYSVEAESAIIGSILLNNDAFDVVVSYVDSTDFYIESNRRVFSSIEDLIDKRIPVDHVTLGSRLIEKGDLEKIGGPMALDNFTSAVSTVANVEHYAGIVQRLSATRRVMYAAQSLVSKGFVNHSSEEISSEVDNVLDASHRLAVTRMPGSLLGYGHSVLDRYKKIRDGYRGIPFMWPSIDRMTTGMWPKTVTLFVARPGVGKSFLAVICAHYVWKSDKRVLIISPEMSKLEIAERFFSIDCDVSYRDMVAGRISDLIYPGFESKVLSMDDGNNNISILDSDDDISPKGINSAIMAFKPDLVVCDSIYDLRISGDRQERLRVAMDWFKNSCKKYEYAALGFAQQNRDAELSEKKGGGSRLGTIALADELGQDAHCIFALEQTKEQKLDKKLSIKPLKIRRGYRGKIEAVDLNWDFDKMNYNEVEFENDDYEGF